MTATTINETLTDLAARERLLGLLKEKSWARRKVILASGKESNFYIDCKKSVLTAEGHYLVGRLLLQLILERAPGAVGVGGLALGAAPLASAVSLSSYFAPYPLSVFLVRKEQKMHGSGQQVEGAQLLPPGAAVVLVDDVITTGASTLLAADRMMEAGFKVMAAFALVDREEGGREAIEARGIPVHALFGRGDFPA